MPDELLGCSDAEGLCDKHRPHVFGSRNGRFKFAACGAVQEDGLSLCAALHDAHMVVHTILQDQTCMI